MTLGQLARRTLGPLFPPVGRAYRRFFVNLDTVAETFPALSSGTHVLDVGGGDGLMLDALLRRHPGVRATMLDMAPSIGAGLSRSVRERVDLLPATSVADYHDAGREPGDVIIVSDVVHHVAPAERPGFFTGIRALVGVRPALLVVKDVEPGGLVAALSLLSDRYVSGDRSVRLCARAEMIDLVRSVFGPVAVDETELHRRNPPNYSLVFRLNPASARKTTREVPSAQEPDDLGDPRRTVRKPDGEDS